MVVHLELKLNEPRTIVTSRVTVGDTLTPGQVSLIIGTRGSKEFQYYALHDVFQFWVEEE